MWWSLPCKKSDYLTVQIQRGKKKLPPTNKKEKKREFLNSESYVFPPNLPARTVKLSFTNCSFFFISYKKEKQTNSGGKKKGNVIKKTNFLQ